MNMSEPSASSLRDAIAFTDVTEFVRVQRSGYVHPFWAGLPTIDIKFEMSDGTEKIMQMSHHMARALANNILKQCGAY
jgi:hypothetical protein